MLTTLLAYVAALAAGYIAAVVVILIFGTVNIALARVLVVAASAVAVLLKQEVPLEYVERLNAKTIAGFFFITGVIEGIAKIFVALVVFRWFEREMGWLMVFIFVAFLLIPFPTALGEQHRSNRRSASAGAILGLVGTWSAVSGLIAV